MLNLSLRTPQALAISCAIIAGTTAAQASSIGAAGLWSDTNGTASAPATTTLSFFNLVTLFSDGIFSGFGAATFRPLDLALLGTVNTPGTVVGTYRIAPGYDGTAWKTYTNGAGDVITFDLNLDATWTRTFDIPDMSQNYEQATDAAGLFQYTGTYNLPDASTMPGTGQLNASSTGTAQLFAITQTAVPATVVPVPASAALLLAGLAAFGLAGRGKAAA